MSERFEEAREMLSATWTLVHGDRPAAQAEDGFLWGAFAALADGRVMVGGPYPSRDAGLAQVMDVLEEAAQALEWLRRRGPG